MSNDDPEGAVADAIVRYLARHPNATDSVTGIHRWWLGGDAPGVSLAVVQRTLDKLVRQGLASRQVLADGSRVYGRRDRWRNGDDEEA
jgi:Fe2+ or Zn2+ uptake regulation protein